MSDLLAADFERLFEGRRDAWGTVEGGQVKEPVTTAHFLRHLIEPGCSLGIYPLIQDAELAAAWEKRLGGPVGDNFVKWGCSDIDTKGDPEAAWPLALNLRRALEALNIPAWIERTKSKGWHVWVFACEWVPAIVMRRALLAAHQVAGVAASEVNPKQTDVGRRVTYGNYVNLPYPAGWERTDRRVIVDENRRAVELHEFVDAALFYSVGFDTLHEAAKLYRPPERPPVVVDRRIELDEALVRRLPGLAHRIFRDGPLPGRDRSGTLQRLAFLCAEAGFEPAETLAVVTDADRRWGKFHGRPDGERHLHAIVTYAHERVQ